jgi:hypothetical protein
VLFSTITLKTGFLSQNVQKRGGESTTVGAHETENYVDPLITPDQMYTMGYIGLYTKREAQF